LIDSPEGISTSLELDNADEIQEDLNDENSDILASLPPKQIEDYVLSLKSSAVHWFHTFYPHHDSSSHLQDEVRDAIDKLNRI